METYTTIAPTPSLKPDTFVRIKEIDVLRGLVMVIMALDHCRELIHADTFTRDPLDVQTTTPIMFFTRWITHFCAPVFVFLSGTSVYLQSLRKSRKELTTFLIKRGVWLMVVDLLVLSFFITFDIRYSWLILQVIWAIGISMILLGLAIKMPFNYILILGLIIVVGHNALDFYESQTPGPYPMWYSLIHATGFFPLSDSHTVAVLYPFLPWTGVMLLGYCFGRLYALRVSKQRRNMIITALGLFLIVFFIALRFTNAYGDPRPWVEFNDSLSTFMSFINTEKYPPSLLYLCMTIGPALLILPLIGKIDNMITRAFGVFGSVPFFYYILHFLLLHLISAGLYLSRGHSFREGLDGIPNFPFKFLVPGEGYNLGVVYLIWILVVAALYPLCAWYQMYRASHKQWWLSYL